MSGFPLPLGTLDKLHLSFLHSFDFPFDSLVHVVSVCITQDVLSANNSARYRLTKLYTLKQEI